MAAKKKVPEFIDGYQSVQAVKRSGKGHAPKTRPSASHLPEQARKAAGKSASAQARVGTTAIPVTHELVCYQCDYAFTMRGQIHYTFCPKCKQELDMSDHTIAGEWDMDVKTMGNILVKSDVVLGKVTLIAQNIIVAGDAREASLEVTRRLELHPTGKIDLKSVSLRDLLICPKTIFSTRRKLKCRHLEIAGSLKAKVQAEGSITIAATGKMMGELYTPTLTVEDGAQISAVMYLGSAIEASAGTNRNAA